MCLAPACHWSMEGNLGAPKSLDLIVRIHLRGDGRSVGLKPARGRGERAIAEERNPRDLLQPDRWCRSPKIRRAIPRLARRASRPSARSASLSRRAQATSKVDQIYLFIPFSLRFDLCQLHVIFNLLS